MKLYYCNAYCMRGVDLRGPPHGSAAAARRALKAGVVWARFFVGVETMSSAGVIVFFKPAKP